MGLIINIKYFIMNVNYKSDFVLIVQFEGGIPTYPWRINFSTVKEGCDTPMGSYTALFDGENYFRAHRLKNSLTEVVIEFTNHSLQPGVLKGEWYATMSNVLFDSGEQLVVTPQITEVNLVEGAGDESVDPEVWSIVSSVLIADGDYTPLVSTSLSNDAVSISNEGIILNASPTSYNNVLGGLVAAIRINNDAELESSWMPMGFDRLSAISARYTSFVRVLDIDIYAIEDDENLGLGLEPENFFCLYHSYQRERTGFYEVAPLTLMSKYSSANISFVIDNNDDNFPGVEVFIFSNSQFWSQEE